VKGAAHADRLAHLVLHEQEVPLHAEGLLDERAVEAGLGAGADDVVHAVEALGRLLGGLFLEADLFEDAAELEVDLRLDQVLAALRSSVSTSRCSIFTSWIWPMRRRAVARASRVSVPAMWASSRYSTTSSSPFHGESLSSPCRTSALSAATRGTTVPTKMPEWGSVSVSFTCTVSRTDGFLLAAQLEAGAFGLGLLLLLELGEDLHGDLVLLGRGVAVEVLHADERLAVAEDALGVLAVGPVGEAHRGAGDHADGGRRA